MRLGLGLARLVEKTPLRWHLPNRVLRTHVIQRAIDGIGARRYLEIGVSSGECFRAIRVEQKTGIDPIAPEPAVVAELLRPNVSYHQMTSDEFFSSQQASLACGVDVAFIDGLHTDHQTYADCLNVLRHLNPGGLILVHDNLPPTAAEATPAANFEEARRTGLLGSNNYWTGDGWKAMVRLRALHPELSACVLNCDLGIGVVWATPGRRVLSCTSAEIDEMTYEDLARDGRRLLGIRPPSRIDEILATCRAMRSPI